MIKLIFILPLILTFSSRKENHGMDNPSRKVSIIYSQPAITYESGQPVFSSQVEITLLRKSSQNGVRLLVNDCLDVKISSEIIELSELIALNAGTYTVV
ncbi:MAG: hypothetical protein AAFY41_00950, partial [Bacteroidota bacterium]